MKQTILLVIAVFWMAAALFSQSDTITNIQVAQRSDGSGLVDVYFDLEGDENSYFINMRVSFDEGLNYYPITRTSLSGNVGPVSPGNNRHVIWDATIDHPNRYSPQTKLMVIAYSIEGITSCPGTPTLIDYDGNVYNTVQIGAQCWMKENLKVTRDEAGNLIERLCYNNITENCELYGGLYLWVTMMNGSSGSYSNPSGVQGICPNGWHVPSDAEWTELTDYLINNYVDINTSNVGNKLKSCRQVNSPLGGDCNTSAHPRWDAYTGVYGTNDFGFSSLPAGIIQGSFGSLGAYAFLWSATSNSNGWLWSRRFSLSSGVLDRVSISYGISYGYSVRCLKD